MIAAMNSLDDNIIECVAKLCMLEDAARLSLTNKRHAKLVSPLLRDMCDIRDFRLLILDEKGPAKWWGLTVWDEARQSSQLVCSLPGNLGFGMQEWDRSQSLGEAAFEISDQNRPSDLTKEVIRTIVHNAGSKFTWSKAQSTVRWFLKQDTSDMVSREEVNRAIDYRIMLHWLSPSVEFGQWVPRRVAETRLVTMISSQNRHWKYLQRISTYPVDNVLNLGWLLAGQVRYRKRTDIRFVKRLYCV